MIDAIFTISENASVMVLILIGIFSGSAAYYQTIINIYEQIKSLFDKTFTVKEKFLIIPFLLLGIYYIILFPQVVVKVLSLIFA